VVKERVRRSEKDMEEKIGVATCNLKQFRRNDPGQDRDGQDGGKGFEGRRAP
jgi:hypothetical protein